MSIPYLSPSGRPRTLTKLCREAIYNTGQV
jgi:hypothetical protein